MNRVNALAIRNKTSQGGKMIVTRRKVLSSALVASVTGARAQASYPVRPITLVVPLSAGGASDVTARVFSKAASEVLGQPIIIQNHPGGGGVVGTTQVRNAKPDGYTLLLALCGVHTTLPEINPLPFDPITGLQPISNLISFLSALVVPSSSPARSLGELLTWARQKPGGLSFGSQAVASPQHMMGIILGKLGNAPVTHVPYTGGGALTMDLVSGRLDFAFPSLLNLGSSFKS
jgi:tripartite-type tricarboxylate transporter receptor subunit TctC